MSNDRFNAYRTMWIMVLFDLPTETKKERRNAQQFRKRLIENGFNMFQFSIYLRFCQSQENADMHMKRIKNLLPEKGKVGIFAITDKQFGKMIIFHGHTEAKTPPPSQQLELF